MAFDIFTQDFTKAAEIHFEFELKLPTGAGSGAKLQVIGGQSATVRNYNKRKFQEYHQKQQIAKRKGREEELSLEDAELLAVEQALVRLVGWSGVTEKGKEVVFSKEKAAEILKQHDWIREQIIQESDDILNFTPKV